LTKVKDGGRSIMHTGHMTTQRPTPQILKGPGLRITPCFGANGCPNAVLDAPTLPEQILEAVTASGFGERLQSALGGVVPMHHTVTISISYCPNGCSRPQIADIGCIGAVSPLVSDAPCAGCGTCFDLCREKALVANDMGCVTAVDTDACVRCGACMASCPTRTLTPGPHGFRVQLGGKLGRHPRLATECYSAVAASDIPALAAQVLDNYLTRRHPRERLGALMERLGPDAVLPS
jgi:dissimilatory sulfite reductase (desulfoviridin) alpha/beta subunit